MPNNGHNEVSTLKEMADMPDAIGWHPARNEDYSKAINTLLGGPGTTFEEMMARTRLDDDERAAMNIALQKAWALERLRIASATGAAKSQLVPTTFNYSKMPAVMRAVHFHGVTGIPGQGEARYEITSALTGGFFSKIGGAAKSPFRWMGNIASRRNGHERIAQ